MKWKCLALKFLADLIISFCSFRNFTAGAQKSAKHSEESQAYTSSLLLRKKITKGFNEGIINEATLKSLSYKRDLFFPFSLLLLNTRPVGRQVLQVCGMFVSTMFTLWHLLTSVSGYCTAFDYRHALGWPFCHSPNALSVLLDSSRGFPCCAFNPSSVIALALSSRLECLIY